MEDTKETTYTLADVIAGNVDALAHFGVVWSVEGVNTAPGGNNSAKAEVCGDAQIFTVKDFDNFVANFPNAKEILLSSNNGTSVRVMAQDVNRRNAGKSVEERRKMILNRLAGARNSGARTVVTKTVTVEVKTYGLPNGQTYKGTDLIEYQQAYIAALMDIGVDPAVAMTAGKAQQL